MTSYLIVAADGSLLQLGRCLPAEVPGQLVPEGCTLVQVTDEQAALLAGSLSRWLWQEGELVAAPDTTPIETLRARALVGIDAAAERARLRFITGGAGQALEYQATEAEARAYDGTGVAEDWPWLAAEQAALAAAGQAVSLTDVAEMAIGLADAWRATGAAIKALRRTAKLQVEAATTAAEIRTAATVSWPSP
jgi:hypothetical protein